MIKGKTKIELFDAKTGQRQHVHESSNMVTNAISQLTNVMAMVNQKLDGYVFPISQKALGGIMLFDGDIEENVNNVFFPTNVHLTGYAGRVEGKGTLRGTYNAIESKETENGFTSVWDFNTSQANGNIKSVCLTSALSGQGPLSYFHRMIESKLYNGQQNESSWYFIRYDGEYAIMLRTDTNTHIATFVKTRIPLLKHKINDYQLHVPLKYETLLEVSTNTDPVSADYADQHPYYFDNGDGYIYIIKQKSNSSGDGIFSYFTINYGDGSYTVSDKQRVIVPDAKFGDTSGVVNNSMYYAMSNDMKGIYRINLKNTNDVSYTRVVREDKDGGANDKIYTHTPVRVPGGGVVFGIQYYKTPSSSEYRSAILYEDGIVVAEDYAALQNSVMTNYSVNCNCYPYGIVALQNDWDSGSKDRCFPSYYSSYLGTINNLPNMITKNSTQTMKITYTLTDA